MAAFQMGKGADYGVAFNRYIRSEYDVRLNHYIAPDDSVIGEPHGFGCGQSRAVFHRVPAGLGLEGNFGCGQIDA